VLVGDAFGFLDPLYSSGVLLALKSGELAADAVAEGLKKSDTSAALYEPGKPKIPTWDAGTRTDQTTDKSNMLVLPQGRTR